MDFAAIIGAILGISALVGGNLLEGGHVGSIIQPTAAFIVIGGTLGATILSFSFSDIIDALKALPDIFHPSRKIDGKKINEIIRYSVTARKKGLLSLEKEIEHIEDAFMKKALRLAIDGASPQILRETMEQEISTHEEKRRRQAKVFDTAGGFAPTIGIIGAVLGLIHVMENLSEPARLGSGIAVAFVATIYGVGIANLILIPLGKKILNISSREIALREMMIEGAIGIQTGMNPHYLREKLRAYLEKEKM